MLTLLYNTRLINHDNNKLPDSDIPYVFILTQAKLEGTLKSSNPHQIAVVSQMCNNIGIIVTNVKNALTDPVTLTFQPQNHIILGYDNTRSFPIRSLNTLGSFIFELCCGQTDKQMEPNILPMPSDSVGLGNKKFYLSLAIF